jgi:nucleoside-diphosphate-sugar epimerase
MRTLIIGGTNFIGPHLVRRLVDGGHQVAVFHRGPIRAELPPSVTHILGDRHRLMEYQDEFRRFDPEVVVDLIAYTEADARGLVATFRGLAQRSVVLSSGDVYRAYGRFIGTEQGPIEPTPLAEDAPLRANWFPYRDKAQGADDFVYSYDKIPVEQTVLSEPDLPATVLRLPMTYGPGDPFRRLSPYLKRMVDQRPVILLDPGLARWKCPLGYVENVAEAIALAIEDPLAASRVYNVADPAAVSTAEWVRTIGEAIGWPGEVAVMPKGRIPLPYHYQQDLDTDTRRIRDGLGLVERVNRAEALARTIAWEQANPPDQLTAVGLLDYETEDAILAESGHPR